MEPEQRNEQDAPEEQHVHESSVEELAEEERFGDVQSEPPEGDAHVEDRMEGLGPHTSADVGGGGGSSTADPGRQDPITPGEGRL